MIQITGKKEINNKTKNNLYENIHNSFKSTNNMDTTCSVYTTYKHKQYRTNGKKTINKYM